MNAQSKYTTGVIFKCESDGLGNYSYYLNSEPLGKGDAGTKVFISKLSSLPNYLTIIVCGLETHDFEEKKFCRSAKYNEIFNKISEKKHWVVAFFKKRTFDYLIKKITFVYVQHDFSLDFRKWIIFFDTKKITIEGTDFSEFIKELDKTNSQFIFFVFDQQETKPKDSRPRLEGLDELQKVLKDHKYSYCIKFISENCCYETSFYNYQSESQKNKRSTQVIAFPKAFYNIKITGKYKSLDAIISEINNRVADTSYTVAASCSNMKLFFEFDEADVSSIIQILCDKYNLKASINNHKIILAKDSIKK